MGIIKYLDIAFITAIPQDICALNGTMALIPVDNQPITKFETKLMIFIFFFIMNLLYNLCIILALLCFFPQRLPKADTDASKVINNYKSN